MTHRNTCAHRASRHFFRRATPERAKYPGLTLYGHETPGNPVLVRRVVVARDAELITAFCRACARDLGTHQVLCFQRTLAAGEVVGVEGDNGTSKGELP